MIVCCLFGLPKFEFMRTENGYPIITTQLTKTKKICIVLMMVFHNLYVERYMAMPRIKIEITAFKQYPLQLQPTRMYDKTAFVSKRHVSNPACILHIKIVINNVGLTIFVFLQLQ